MQWHYEEKDAYRKGQFFAILPHRCIICRKWTWLEKMVFDGEAPPLGTEYTADYYCKDCWHHVIEKLW
jgi:hypothetical protein